jgi:hypothetical protein
MAYYKTSDFEAAKKIKFSSLITDGLSASFMANITSFSDNYTSTWNKEEVYGRMDPLATFARTGRSVSLGWTTHSGSPSEGKVQLQKANNLVTMSYPKYQTSLKQSTAGGNKALFFLSNPPLVRVKLPNMVTDSRGGTKKGLIALIESISVTPDFEPGVYEGKTDLIPKVINFECSLTVLHEEQIGNPAPMSQDAMLSSGKSGGIYATFPYSTDGDIKCGSIPGPLPSTGVINNGYVAPVTVTATATAPASDRTGTVPFDSVLPGAPPTPGAPNYQASRASPSTAPLENNVPWPWETPLPGDEFDGIEPWETPLDHEVETAKAVMAQVGTARWGW